MFEIRKRINRIKIKLGYRLGFSKAIGMPKLITIDPTNHCNLKCPLCPTGLGDTSVEYGLLKLDKFKEVVDVFSKWAQTVQLFSWGEPVLNKSFPEMIRYASQNPHKIRSTTSVNLNATNDEQIKGLLTSNLDALHVSIDGVTQEVYEKYRVGGNLEIVFDNLKKLIATKKLYKSETKIIWDFIVMRQNEHQVEEAKKMANDFGIPINIDLVRPHLKEDTINPTEKMIDNYGEWLPKNPQYNNYNMDTKKRNKSMTFCKSPWTSTAINWNGDVFPCSCVHTEEKDRMGNIFEQSFKEIWHGEKYVAARKELLGQPNDLETICHTCKKNGYPGRESE
jgi:radical SAM protein with 4Fe4S-binding SPASM domain